MGTIIKDDKIYNRLTATLDKNLTFKREVELPLNYIYNEKFTNSYAIRCLGATRGCVTVDKSNVITSVRIYHDNYRTDTIYCKEIDKILEQFVGCKLIIEEEVVNEY